MYEKDYNKIKKTQFIQRHSLKQEDVKWEKIFIGNLSDKWKKKATPNKKCKNLRKLYKRCPNG